MITHLVADVLDEQLTDRHGEPAGRIDGIVLRLRADRPPVVTHIEVGPVTMLARFSRRLARWYAKHDRKLGPERGEPFRIPWHRVERKKRMLQFDGDLESTPINALEDWLRAHIVDHLPGA